MRDYHCFVLLSVVAGSLAPIHVVFDVHGITILNSIELREHTVATYPATR